MDPPRLGIFGGTFDPPHLGHLVVAGDVWETLGLDRLFFVPARLPPHRTGEMLTDPSIRLEMVREAVRGDPRFAASDVEVTREGPSFTVDTLRHFRDRHAEARLFVILGVDQFARIATWHEADRVVRLARMVVFARGGGAALGGRSGHGCGLSVRGGNPDRHLLERGSQPGRSRAFDPPPRPRRGGADHRPGRALHDSAADGGT